MMTGSNQNCHSCDDESKMCYFSPRVIARHEATPYDGFTVDILNTYHVSLLRSAMT